MEGKGHWCPLPAQGFCKERNVDISGIGYVFFLRRNGSVAEEKVPMLAPEHEGAWDSGSGNAITTAKGCELCTENERLPAGMESD